MVYINNKADEGHIEGRFLFHALGIPSIAKIMYTTHQLNGSEIHVNKET